MQDSNSKHAKNSDSGFSLIELLVVSVVIAMVALGLIGFQQGRVNAVKRDLVQDIKDRYQLEVTVEDIPDVGLAANGPSVIDVDGKKLLIVREPGRVVTVLDGNQEYQPKS